MFNDELYDLIISVSGNVDHFRSISKACKDCNDKDGEMFYSGKSDAYYEVLVALKSYSEDFNGR